MSLIEARDIEQQLIDSGEFPMLVNSRKVNKITDLSDNDILELHKYLQYSETSPTFLIWKQTKGCRAIAGQTAGHLSFDKNKLPKSTDIKFSGLNLKCSRVIWILFNGKIPENMIIDHIDGNPHNNLISNLRCISTKENAMNRSSKIASKVLPSGIYI